MRQGYIDSQGNKYILTGVKAQFPRWTYAEWQAEGEPDIPWIRIDAPSGYRKVSGSDVSYDNTTSVNTAITNANTAITTLTPRTRADITSASALDGLALNTTMLAYVSYSGAPYVQIWATIRTFGSDIVKNQEFICANGSASRHYEAGAWSAWKKVNFS